MNSIDNFMWALGVFLGALFSWLITRYYYRKSLASQTDACSQHIASFIESARVQATRSGAELKMKRMGECLQEYKRAGTPVRLIETYTDLTDSQKADMLDEVLVLARGRKAKNNKFRNA